MIKRIERLLRWLYPGIGVKRWAGMAVIGALVATTGILAWVGRDLVSGVYYYLSPSDQHTFWVAAAMMVGGVGALLIGINRSIHAIVSGISPESQGRTSELLYSRRRLRRGPRIVAIGGGTGLSSLLRGLKEWTANATAVVTVMDDGGSSGRLREEMKMLPPGDIRNCIIALAEDESQIASLFQHRFKNGSGSLDGHSLGNLILAGLQQNTGRFDVAVEELSHILKVRGQVLPTTLEDVKLVAQMQDGGTVTGEVAIAEDPRRIERMYLSREQVQPYRKVIQAIEDADIIVMGPGSLFTSIVPNLLVDGVPQAIERSKAVTFYVANLMTQPGETDDFTLADHVCALGRYVNLKRLDYVIVNGEPFPTELEKQYRQEGAVPVKLDSISHLTRARLLARDLCSVADSPDKRTLKHDAMRLAQTIIQHAR